MSLGGPLSLLVEDLLLLAATFGADVFGASLAFVDSLELSKLWLKLVQ